MNGSLACLRANCFNRADDKVLEANWKVKIIYKIQSKVRGRVRSKYTSCIKNSIVISLIKIIEK